jgi:hypothetical protein
MQDFGSGDTSSNLVGGIEKQALVLSLFLDKLINKVTYCCLKKSFFSR